MSVGPTSSKTYLQTDLASSWFARHLRPNCSQGQNPGICSWDSGLQAPVLTKLRGIGHLNKICASVLQGHQVVDRPSRWQAVTAVMAAAGIVHDLQFHLATP